MEKNFVNSKKDFIPTKNDSPYERILAIGDVHGDFNNLMLLLERVAVTDEDLVIFLGDYIDRGAGVAEVLEFIMEHKKNFIFLRGNHEQMMLDAFCDDWEFMEKILNGEKNQLTTRDAAEHENPTVWIINGGRETVSALVKLQAENKFTVDEVLEFVANLPLSYTIKIDGRKYFFCHAGVEAGVPLEKQNGEILLWTRGEFFKNYDGDDVIISGHTPVQKIFDFGESELRPVKFPGKNILLVDTGSYREGGCISCVDIIGGEYWQSDKN